MSASASAEFRVGLASCGVANGARPVFDALEAAVREAGQGTARAVGCGGMCHREPLVEVVESDGGRVVYTHVSPADVPGLVRRHLKPRGLLTRARWLAAGLADRGNGVSPAAETAAALGSEAPRIVLESCGLVDPLSLDDALAHGAYEGLRRCLEELTPEQVIEQVSAAGLRGRGGAGFPTGRKWALARAQPAPKYVICNGDEGDPGAFMDRLVLESDPHRVVEGLAIAAFAMGAEDGFFYIRAEYPRAVRRVREAIRQAEERGFLGDGVMGTDVRLRFEVREGAGAFVCGEETALMASIEGGRGQPRPRPPYPAESGLWGRPTLINNVETYANIAPIIREGGDWFASIGTEKSKGTKVFALAGTIVNTGLIEVPMGTTLRDIIHIIGGGIPDGRAFKAVQTGGPSGGCVPEQHLDIAVDYDSLKTLGTMMGSGGMIVMDERSSMVDVARYFMEFCMTESCGKCVPCRTGTQQMHGLLHKIAKANAGRDDLALLEELCEVVQATSLCGLGQTAPNPVLSTLRYFRDEYEQKLGV